MAIVAEGKVPVFNKELNKYVSKEDMEKLKAEAEEEKLAEAATASKDYGAIADAEKAADVATDGIIDGAKFDTEDEVEDLPF
jgi:Cys-tRNA synthase (O-phospho-L-seryl-tRNA:Cys-tRNA synthase)